MRTIWKFPVVVEDQFTHSIPRGATPLCVDVQGGSPYVWMLLEDDRNEEILYTFYVHGTGHEVGDNREYIGSFQMFSGKFVGHLFWRP